MLTRFTFIFSLFISSAVGQNLVDNWSFEDTTHCPSWLTDITASSGWRSYKASPDYFNECNQNLVGVPENVAGYQNPHSGSGYAGIFVYNANGNSSREVVGRQLNTILQIGNKYYVSLYVVRSVTHNPNFLADIACNNIGVNFSTIEYGFPNGAWPLNLNSQVFSDSIITDTVAWTKISGSFIADSAYQYIGISNFFPDSLTDRIVYGNNVTSYYFIDDICVSPDSTYCDLLSTTSQTIDIIAASIYPNPATDVIRLKLKGEGDLIIYDSIGRMVLHNNKISNNQEVNISSLPEGMYFAVIRSSVSNQKFIIEKINNKD